MRQISGELAKLHLDLDGSQSLIGNSPQVFRHGSRSLAKAGARRIQPPRWGGDSGRCSSRRGARRQAYWL